MRRACSTRLPLANFIYVVLPARHQSFTNQHATEISLLTSARALVRCNVLQGRLFQEVEVCAHRLHAHTTRSAKSKGLHLSGTLLKVRLRCSWFLIPRAMASSMRQRLWCRSAASAASSNSPTKTTFSMERRASSTAQLRIKDQVPVEVSSTIQGS